MSVKNKYDKQHLKNIQRYSKQIESIYDAAAKEAAAISGIVSNFDPLKPFSFVDYPITKHRLDKLLSNVSKQAESVIINGIKAEWEVSNIKNDELVRDSIDKIWMGKRGAQNLIKNSKRYFQNNERACEAFIARKEQGLDLSDRVWKYANQFKQEIEMGIDIGLRDGKSAEGIGRDLRQYLQHPDKLFRRVRDKHGQLHLSKKAAAYHPEAGMYRSSRKNALRLARTETNIAYRTSDFTRWQQLDFVVGIEIKASNNHPAVDICDSLNGKYPKDFKFSGWHPQCFCYAIPILKTMEEMQTDNERMMNGEQVVSKSVNTVQNIPINFKDWVQANNDRIDKANVRGTLPYFLKDNRKRWTDFSTLKIINQQMIGKASEYANAFGNKAESIAKSLGVMITPVNIKSERRIFEKALADYNGDIAQVSDIIRNTFIASSDNMSRVLSSVQSNFKVIRHKLQETNMGYSGHLFQVWAKDGVKAEIQVNTPQMIYAKEPAAKSILGNELYGQIRKASGIKCGLGHKYYEEYRTLLIVQTPTTAQLRRLSELETLSKNYYKKIGSVVL